MSQFTWNPEKQELTNMSDLNLKYLYKEYSCRTLEVALMEYGNVPIDDFWDIYDKFQEEKANIKQKVGYDGKPDYNTNSLKAWCKRNMGKYYSEYSLGSFSLFGYGNDIYITYDRELIQKQIERSFTSLMYDLKTKEYKWFRKHNEYCIIEDKCLEYIDKHYYNPFDISVWHGGGDEGIHIRGEERDKYDIRVSRKPTLEELKQMFDYFNKVQEAIKSVAVPEINY